MSTSQTLLTAGILGCSFVLVSARVGAQENPKPAVATNAPDGKADKAKAPAVVAAEAKAAAAEAKEAAAVAATEAKAAAEAADKAKEAAAAAAAEAKAAAEAADKAKEAADVADKAKEPAARGKASAGEADKAKEAADAAAETNAAADAARKAKAAAEAADKAKEATDKAKEATDKAKEATDKAKEATDKAKEAADKAKDAADKAKEAADKTEAPDSKGDVGDMILEARCKVAICFGNNSIGIEPLVELPVGKSFSVNSGPVADYINNHDLRIDLAAGVRVWAFRDWVSLSVYLSKPLSDRSIRIPGSEVNYPASSLRRPLPGFALGLLFDSIWLGLDRDELRNPDGTAGVWHDPSYPPNALVGSSWTVTLALQPVTAFRTGLGVAVTSATKKLNATGQQAGGGQ